MKEYEKLARDFVNNNFDKEVWSKSLSGLNGIDIYIAGFLKAREMAVEAYEPDNGSDTIEQLGEKEV